jgi:replicative DNA helicase
MPREETINRILRSLCANRPEESDTALENFAQTNFAQLNFDGPALQLLEHIKRYHTTLSGPPSSQELSNQCARLGETEESLLAQELIAHDPLWGANYNALLESYREDLGKEFLKEALQQAAQIAEDGTEERVGREIVKRRGLEDASHYLIEQIVKIQRTVDPTQRSMDNEAAASYLHQQYIKRRDQPTLAYGMATGFYTIDDATKGGQIGELWTVAGFISHGKTSLCLNWARYLSVEGGFNGMIFSLEMTDDQVWRILATGHSAHPKWNGRDPLDYDKVKSGTLSREDELFYLNELLPDLENPEHGRIEVLTPTGHTTMSNIRAQAEVLNRSCPLDYIIIDYIGLLGSEKGSRVDKKERINENIVRAKQMAIEFDRGAKLLVITPHQINRGGYKKAQENGGIYEVEALSDANEAERSSDVVICIYQDPPMRQKSEATICMLKNRDGRIIEPFNVYAPPPNRFMADITAPGDQRRLDEILDA